MSDHPAPVQSFIGLDGPGGQVYQVSSSEYLSYWKRLGYKNLGAANTLPGFDLRTVKQNEIEEAKS